MKKIYKRVVKWIKPRIKAVTLDFRAIANIKFIFDKKERRGVVIDNIGFMKDLRNISADN